MGSPTFYLYPKSDGALVTVTLPQPLSDLRTDAGAVCAVPVTADGVPSTLLERTTLRVRIRFGPYGHQTNAAALYRGMHLVQGHLDRGGVVGFAADSAKAWCGVIPGAPNQGGATLRTTGNGFSTWAPLAAFASGDEIVLEEGAPGWRSEMVTYTSQSGQALTVAGLGPGGGFAHAYSSPPILVRHRDFFPVLWRAQGERDEPMMTADRRMSYTLDCELQYSPAMVLALFNAGAYGGRGAGAYTPTGKGPYSLLSGALPLSGTSGPGRGGMSIDQALGITSNRARSWG